MVNIWLYMVHIWLISLETRAWLVGFCVPLWQSHHPTIYGGYVISICFGDVKQIPNSWDINPKPCLAPITIWGFSKSRGYPTFAGWFIIWKTHGKTPKNEFSDWG